MSNLTNSKNISIKRLANGLDLSINVIEIIGKKPGPTTYIQTSVHGAEIQGNLVIFKLLEYLKINSIMGKIIIVPNANPYATIQKSGPYTQGRFNPVTGNNYNRNYTDIFSNKEFLAELENFVNENPDDKTIKINFKKFISSKIDDLIQEKRIYGLSDDFFLNITLQQIASEADICLDLHTGPIACEYLYSNSSQKEEVLSSFPFEFILDIPETFAGAMDEAFFINYSHLNKILEKKNRPTLSISSYTVELGSEEFLNSELAENFTHKIIHFLAKKGQFGSNNLPRIKLFKQKKYISLSNYKTYYAPTGGHVEYIASPGAEIKKGDLLAKIYSPSNNENAFNVFKVTAVNNGWIINYQNSSTVHEGMELFQIGENAQLYPSN